MRNKVIESFLYSKMIGFIITFTILLSYCYTSNFPVLEYAVEMFIALLVLIIIAFYLVNCEISKMCLIFIIYCASLFISSLLGEDSLIVIFLRSHYQIVALVFYLDYGLRHYCKTTVNTFYFTYSILVLINFYTIVAYPDGLYVGRIYDNNWFFKYDNTHIFMYVPTFMFMFLDQYLMKRKLNYFDYLIIIIITYCIFYCFSATAVVAYIILMGYLIFRKYIDKKNICNSKTYFLTYIISFIGFVILRIQEMFSFIIVKVLGKNLTFSGRTKIWDNIMIYIKEKILIGYGAEKAAFVGSKLGHSSYAHAHNTILDVLYNGGIVALVLFFIMLILPINELYKYRKYKISKLLSIILFVFLMMMNFEAIQENVGLYMVLISCFNIRNIIKDETDSVSLDA